jgi:serine/threonine-protein kinase
MTEAFQAQPTGAPFASYVIKTVAADAEHPEAAVLALHREAHIARLVVSPHIAPVLSANLAHTHPFIVLPFLPGASLAEVLERGERPFLPLALWLARQVAEALVPLHAAGWLHGDIKPANVVVAPSGHATLIDLGFASLIKRPNQFFDSERPLVGSFNYLAPELLTSNQAGDARSDLYSLGVMLFELLSGRVPFAAGTVGDLVRQHREERPPDLRIVECRIPRSVCRFVATLMAKHPSRRPPSAAEVVSRLAALEIESFAQRQ